MAPIKGETHEAKGIRLQRQSEGAKEKARLNRVTGVLKKSTKWLGKVDRYLRDGGTDALQKTDTPSDGRDALCASDVVTGYDVSHEPNACPPPSQTESVHSVAVWLSYGRPSRKYTNRA